MMGMNGIVEQLVHGFFNERPGQAVESIDFVNTRYDPDTHIFTTVVEVSIARRKQDRRTIEVHFELVNLHVWMTTPADKAEIASWNSKAEGECLMAIAEAMRNTAPAMKDRALPGPVNYAQIPELAERGRARLLHFLDRLDAHLAGREFLAASGFSIADITCGVAVDFARVLRIDPGEGRPNVAAWRARLADRPAFNL